MCSRCTPPNTTYSTEYHIYSHEENTIHDPKTPLGAAPMGFQAVAASQVLASTALTDRLDGIILVTGLLLSPMYSTKNMPDVSGKPVLSAIAFVACALDACGLLTSMFYRLRLKLMSSDTREVYSKQLYNSRFNSFLSILSPMALFASSALLFLISISGPLFSTMDAAGAIESVVRIPQLAMLAVGLSFLLMHGRLVLNSLPTDHSGY